ncbi:unnamed protein product [Soboliphyme baturini]|uniref:G-patch domain-containing protein n=1 Tax=Soboliphyme baturini TaxID=241478 RepID=A0A183J618_9BILA|nr:unnamed protein product [Soboliphyme baturini]
MDDQQKVETDIKLPQRVGICRSKSHNRDRRSSENLTESSDESEIEHETNNAHADHDTSSQTQAQEKRKIHNSSSSNDLTGSLSESGSEDDKSDETKQSLDDSQPQELPTKNRKFDNKAWGIMSKMGYKEGTGLGAKEHGRKVPVDVKPQYGKRGLGLVVKGIEPSFSVQWDFEHEDASIFELIS